MGYAEEARLDSARRAILKTLIYSDIFDFPLTQEELWKFLISSKKIQRRLFEDRLQKLTGKQVSKKNGYFCLNNREKLIERRINNLQEVEKKLQIARIAAKYLSHIPTILFIGLSGGLAMNDATPSDDIDFFIITKKQKLYESRFWILLVLEMLGLRRTRNDKDAANKICVNFFIDETKLLFTTDKHDLYLAHEIVQIKPLFERQDMYSKFLSNNIWVRKFFPNALPTGISKMTEKLDYFTKILFFLLTLLPFETLFRTLQIAYMRKPRDTKKVTKHALVFHPNDYRVQILKKMRLKLQQIGLLTKI